MRARGVEPPNHMKDNARSIKRLEAQVRARRDKENEPKEPEWKIERFKHVPSKLAEVFLFLHVFVCLCSVSC